MVHKGFIRPIATFPLASCLPFHWEEVLHIRQVVWVRLATSTTSAG